MAKKKSTLKAVPKETAKPQFQLPELKPDDVPICLTGGNPECAGFLKLTHQGFRAGPGAGAPSCRCYSEAHN